MDWDWAALGVALRERRLALGLTRENVGERANAHPGTVKNYEAGERTYDHIPGKLIGIEAALDLKPGSVKAKLEGGEFTPLTPVRSQQVIHEGDMDPSRPLSERLPTSIMHALEGREVYATDTYDLTLGGGLMLVGIVVRDPDAPDAPKDPERLRRENRAWSRAQRQLRGLAPLAWEPGDPEEWREDSGTDKPE